MEDEIFNAFCRPVRQLFETIDLNQLSDFEPAFTFNPIVAAGGEAPYTEWDIVQKITSSEKMISKDKELTNWTVLELLLAVRAGKVNPVDILTAYHNKISIVNPYINAFILTLEPEISTLPEGQLKGVPFGLKDIIDVAGVTTTAGSLQLNGRIPEQDAEVANRLMNAGAILLGKLNTHEFADGATGDNPHFGPVRNPWNLNHFSGGSSSGSAAAVAARIAPFALGTDTAGSVRIPASCCGVVGLKPTYGLVSRSGVLPLSWSLDHVGILSRSVRDAGIILDVITDRPVGFENVLAAPINLEGLRIGIPQNWIENGVELEVRAAFESALEALRLSGCIISEVKIPSVNDLAAIARSILFSEASAWHLPFLKSSPELYGEDVRARKEAGLKFQAFEYINAHRIRAQYCTEMHNLWSNIDILATPTTPLVAPSLNAHPKISADLSRFTIVANLLGWPAISVPCGFNKEGLPVGIQLIAPPYRELRLLRVAAAYEDLTLWSSKAPNLEF
ncbi:amidase [Paenibacillus filicis]|uniref:Amidase n=1 Tax=Paenibacillus gyeongsangnamensis TaxID=3388067 RepID=A0ABT4Q3X3_9BACL|nr:amidase [Paenibacillus filicis]MCZ8511571.1 amidase [Paenibacillus filicis]